MQTKLRLPRKLDKKGDLEINQTILIILGILALIALLFLAAGWGRQTFIAFTQFFGRMFS